MKINAVVMNPNDNVATAIAALKKDDPVSIQVGEEIKSASVREEVPFLFKFALHAIKAGEPVLKYGEQIGLATAEIQEGMVVHVHNCQGARARGDLAKD